MDSAGCIYTVVHAWTCVFVHTHTCTHMCAMTIIKEEESINLKVEAEHAKGYQELEGDKGKEKVITFYLN